MYNPITCPVPYLGQFENKYVSAEKELASKMYPGFITERRSLIVNKNDFDWL